MLAENMERTLLKEQREIELLEQRCEEERTKEQLVEMEQERSKSVGHKSKR